MTGARNGWSRPAAVAASALLGILLVLAGCSSDDPAPGTASAGDEPTDATAGDASSAAAANDAEPPDIKEEVGDFHPGDAYVEEPLEEDAPEPPESVVQVLCNLNSTYLAGLADLGMSDDGANMPLAALSLNDNIQVWETLVGHYPDTRADLDRAKQIHNYWREAMAHQEVGDTSAADELYGLADAEIAELSGTDSAEEIGCAT